MQATQQSWQQGEESEWQRRIADLTAHRSTEATSHEQQLLQLQGIVEALEQQKQSEASKAAQYIAALEAQHRTDEATLSGNADLTRELQARVHTQQRTLQVLEVQYSPLPTTDIKNRSQSTVLAYSTKQVCT